MFIAGLLTLITLDRKGGRTELPAHARIPIVLVSFIGGMITGWVEIGEGEIIAASCMLAYGLNANRAIGLGVVLLSLNSLILASIHALYFGGVPWDMAVFTLLGVLWGGRLGPFLAQWITPARNKKGFRLYRVARWLDDYLTGKLCDVFSVKDLNPASRPTKRCRYKAWASSTSCRDALYIRYRSDRAQADGAARGRHGTPDLDLLQRPQTSQGFPGPLRGDAGSALHRTGRFMKARLAELSALGE